MKYSIVYLALFFVISISSLSAQNAVGIGTENPQGIFHIDANKNTSGATNTSDDVVVNADGNVGIGKVTGITGKVDVSGNSLIIGDNTIEGNASVTNNIRTDQLKYGSVLTAPKAKLDIEASVVKSGFRLKNTSEATSPVGDERKHIPVLATDNNNNVYWMNLPNAVSAPVEGTIKTGTVLSYTTSSNNDANKFVELTNGSTGRITLGPGHWLISAKCMIGTGNGAGTGTGAGSNGYASLSMLLAEPTPSDNADCITGAAALGETSGFGICVLQFTYLYEVPTGQTKTLALYLRTNRLTKAYITYDWTPSYFDAVKLD